MMAGERIACPACGHTHSKVVRVLTTQVDSREVCHIRQRRCDACHSLYETEGSERLRRAIRTVTFSINLSAIPSTSAE